MKNAASNSQLILDLLKIDISDIFSKHENMLLNFSQDFDIPGISLTTCREQMTAWAILCRCWFSCYYEKQG